MRTRRTETRDEDENVFALSTGDLMAGLLLTGDLMAGLLFTFILIFGCAMLLVSKDIENNYVKKADVEKDYVKKEDIQKKLDELEKKRLELQRKAEEDARIAREYDHIKRHIYKSLMEAFHYDELQAWGATIDPKTLSITFQNVPMFDEGQYVLKPSYRNKLDNFFPRYIEAIGKYQDSIEEIRIEGHTNSNYNNTDTSCRSGANCGYYYNMKLSQDRARSVLEYCMDMMRNSPRDNRWLVKKLTANGLSFSHLICKNGREGDCAYGSEDKDKSRRVEFRIRTNAEKQLEEIAERRRASE